MKLRVPLIAFSLCTGLCACSNAPAPNAPAPAPPVQEPVAKPAPTAEAPPPELPVLVDVRAATHPGFDRLVFEFASDRLPQWRAEPVQIPVTDCGAGQVVPVSGTAWLQVRFSGAAAHTPEGEATSGPRQRRLGLPVLRDLVRTCDFEGEVTWVAGLAGAHPHRTDVLVSPPRLVVDIAH